MNKYKNLIIFLIILSIWSSFFSIIKYFLWGDLNSNMSIDLQTISGYLSLGAIFSYLIGGAISSSFPKGKLLGYISIFTILIVYISNIISINNYLFLGLILTSIGFLYGLWTIVKNILIPIEIKETGLSDIRINAFAGIIFVIFIIIGAITGSLIFENYGHNGFYFQVIILFIVSILSFFLKYKDDDKYKGKKIKKELKLAIKEYIPEVKFILNKYYKILIATGLLWAISTIISQVIIEYSVLHFNKTNSEAGLLLLYSAGGAILGNILSINMGKFRWKAIVLFNFLFSLIIFSFPLIVTISYNAIIIGAFIVGIFFGIVSNLIDAYYLNQIGIDKKKEYGSSTYGLILSIIIFILMFISSYINKHLGFNILMFVLGSLIFSISLIFYKKTKLGK